jgi:hypothetical protein
VLLGVKSGTGKRALLISETRVCCIWNVLVGCFFLPSFLDPQEESVFVALASGDELPRWQLS